MLGPILLADISATHSPAPAPKGSSLSDPSNFLFTSAEPRTLGTPNLPMSRML